jgi:acid phosphatase (class A)
MRSTITLLSVLLACAAVPHSTGAAERPATQAAAVPAPAARPAGYLTGTASLDVRAILGAPPAPGTPAEAADRAAYEAALKGRGGRAWTRAIAQASPRSPETRAQMMCAIGIALAPRTAPAFTRVMARSAVDLSAASEAAKAAFGRSRPYAGDPGAVTCIPDPNFGSQNPTYPSGHAAIGWMWGLMLAEWAPDRASQALAWGVEMGDNRLACRVHYPSDVAAGRTLGAAVLARLRGDAAFRADFEAARAEIAAARAAGAKPDCGTD